MRDSHWHKENRKVFFTVVAVTVAISLLLFALLQSIQPANTLLVPVVQTFAFVVGFAVAKILSNRNPDSFKRSLEMKYEEAEFTLRMMLKKQSIRFDREIDTDFQVHTFRFVGHDLRIVIQPYELDLPLGRDAFSQKLKTDSPRTLVTILDVKKANAALANRLAEAVDEMANQPAGNSDET